MVDTLNYFSFQPVHHDWCNKGCGMCYPVCGMLHKKEPLLCVCIYIYVCMYVCMYLCICICICILSIKNISNLYGLTKLAIILCLPTFLDLPYSKKEKPLA